jgi:hypothetical protein
MNLLDITGYLAYGKPDEKQQFHDGNDAAQQEGFVTHVGDKNVSNQPRKGTF